MVFSINLAITLTYLITPFAPGNIIYLRLRVTATVGHDQEGAGVQKCFAKKFQLEFPTLTILLL